MNIRRSQFAKYGFIISLVLILYNTLIPFHLYTQPSKIIRNIGRIEWVPFLHNGNLVPPVDLLGNIILFLPIGFFAALYFMQDRKNISILVKTTIIGFGFSLFIETTQLLFKYRISSAHDLITNSFGAILGGLLAILVFTKYYHITKNIFNKILMAHPHNILFLLFSIYKIIDILLPDEIIQRAHNIELAWGLTGIITVSSTSVFLLFKNFVMYFFIGLFLSESLKNYRASKSFYIYVFSSLLIFLLAAEAFHILFYKIPGDVNLIIISLVGFGLGLKTGFYWIKNRIRNPLLTDRFFKLLVFSFFLYVFIDGFFPYKFNDFSPSELSIKNFVPFYFYFKETSFFNIKDVVYSLTVSIPIGGYISFIVNNRSHSARMLVALAAIFILSMIVEIGQLFISTRVADITDVLLMMIGATIGSMFHIYHKQIQTIRESRQ